MVGGSEEDEDEEEIDEEDLQLYEQFLQNQNK